MQTNSLKESGAAKKKGKKNPELSLSYGEASTVKRTVAIKRGSGRT